MFKILLLIVGVLFSQVALAQTVDYAEVAVRVEKVARSKGEVGVAVFSSPKGFPIHLEHSYEVKWVPVMEGMEVVEVVFEALPAGNYAVTAVHDENGNRITDRNNLGFPKEGVAFSNDQRVTTAAPSYKSCQFSVKNGDKKKIVTRLDYKSGR